MVRQGASTRMLKCRARVALRSDDKAVLDWIQSMFGGALSYRAATRSWSWQLTAKDDMRRVIDVLLGGQIPSKKRKEVLLVDEANRLQIRRGEGRPSDFAVKRASEIRDELKRLRAFSDGSN